MVRKNAQGMRARTLDRRCGRDSCFDGAQAGSGANARVAGDDEEMQRFVPIEDLFNGRHFDGQIIILCVAWYTSFKLNLSALPTRSGTKGTRRPFIPANARVRGSRPPTESSILLSF